jgi:hypothetical protein
MTKTRFIRLGGWALVLGAVTFSLGLFGQIGRALNLGLGVPDAQVGGAFSRA